MPDLDETKVKQLMSKFAPKNDEEFKNVFLKWIRHFMAKYLMKSLTPFQEYLFYIKWNGDLMDKLNPDIAGAMTHSILNVQQILRCTCCPTPEETRKKQIVLK